MDNIQKDLVKKAAIKCKAKGIRVTHDLLSLLVTLLQLNPDYEVLDNDDERNTRTIQAVIEMLKNQEKPSLIMLKNQLYFAKHYHERDETIKRHRLCLHQKTKPLVAEICETDTLEGDQAMKLYQKIVITITLLSGLGNPAIPDTFREVSAALRSVFQPSELTHYVTLSKCEKEEQLMELMCIVAGIRIFNRDCQRGGEGIDDLPSILQDAIERTYNSILEILEQLMLNIYKFTAALDNSIPNTWLHEDARTCCGSFENVHELPSNVTDEDVEWAIEMLAANRQQEIYIRKLLSDVEYCQNEINNRMQRLQGRLLKIHDTVRYRTAIPTTQIYPQFIDLTDIWMGLQDEVIVLSNINNFLWELHNFNIKTVNVYNQEILKNMLVDAVILTDAERLERSMGVRITECEKCVLYYPDVTEAFDKIDIEFLGFCASKFVIKKGALIPGNPNYGIAKWRGKYYAFSSLMAARKFGKNPDRYIYEALNFMKKHPEYIYLFQLHEDIRTMHEQSPKEGPPLKIHHNQEVQTDLHVLLPSRNNYTSNIWELRRRALRLASISQCATRSTQTCNSHFRSSAYVQAAPPQDQNIQTMRDNYTNTKKLKTFIFGLRGRRDDNQHVISFLEDEFETL